MVAETVPVIFDRLVRVFEHEESGELGHFVLLGKCLFFLFYNPEF
jgi:hypothetical protein